MTLVGSMSIFELSSILVSISALLMLINFKFIKMPMTIGVMLLSLIFSMFLILFAKTSIVLSFSSLIDHIDFNETLMHGMLSFLLFAGALHVDLSDLLEQKFIILLLATLGVIFSTFLIGSVSFYIFNNLFSIPVDYIYCLLFGALISPTDPIAVLGILKETNSPKTLETTIAGESLFNDGVGVVVFSVILSNFTLCSDLKTLSEATHDQAAIFLCFLVFNIPRITLMLSSGDSFSLFILLFK